MICFLLSAQNSILSNSTLANSTLANSTLANSTLTNSILSNSTLANSLLSLYLILALIIGTLSNLVVIYASTKYRSFGLDKVTIYFVRHLAYADLLTILCLGLPMLIVHCAGGWVLGNTLCSITSYLYAVLPYSTLCFTALVGVHRLLRCTIPNRAWVVNKRHAVWISLVMWCVSCAPAVIKAAYRLPGVFFPPWATCFYNTTSELYPKPVSYISQAFQTVFSLTLLIANMSLITLSIKNYMRKNPQRKAKSSNKAVYFISILYFISWLPVSVSYWAWVSKKLDMPLWTHNLLHHLILLRNVGNPVVYCLVNTRFCEFIVRLILRRFPSLSSYLPAISQLQVNPVIIKTTTGPKIGTNVSNKSVTDGTNVVNESGTSKGGTADLTPAERTSSTEPVVPHVADNVPCVRTTCLPPVQSDMVSIAFPSVVVAVSEISHTPIGDPCVAH